jgi:hypothetical protein
MFRSAFSLSVLAFACGCAERGVSVSRTQVTNLAPGSYQIAVTQPRMFHRNRPIIEGVLVLRDSTIPMKAEYWMMRHSNGCFWIRGDLRAIALPRLQVRVPDSIAGLTAWEPDSVGQIKLAVFQGVDYGYWVTLALDGENLRGAGRYFGLGAAENPHETQWRGTRIGEANTTHCTPAIRQDSIWAARRVR